MATLRHLSRKVLRKNTFKLNSVFKNQSRASSYFPVDDNLFGFTDEQKQMSKNYTDEKLKEAISAVKKNQLTISKAAREFNIPRTTITDHIKNPNMRTKKGPEKQLTNTETEGLVNYLLYMAGQGFPLSRKMVRCYVQEILRRSGRNSLFNLEKGPSDEWFRKLIADYPQLAFRKPESRDRGRSSMSNKAVCDEFFEFWTNMLIKHSVIDKPSQVFNCDETGWSGKECAREKVIGPKSGHLYQQKVMTNDHVTAHLCVAADGRFIPTMIIFKGGLPHRNYKDGLPGSWLFSASESGYMDSEIFLQWFVKAFLPNCGKDRPVVLLMDNHESHISLPLIETARKENIILVGLPSHTTHYLQPLDVRIIGPVKDKVARLAASVGFARPGSSISKSRLPVLLSYAIDQTAPSTVKEAFRLAGIMPVNPAAVDTSQLVPPTFPPEERVGDGEPTQTCETCGQFIGENPLVKRGIVPACLAEILVPPPAKPLSQRKRSSKAVPAGRVLSGDEMLKMLKEREETELKKQEEKKQREEERDIKRKQRLVEDELKAVKRQKREAEKNEREQEKLKERERKEKFGKLADKKYTCGVCGVRGRVFDEINGVEWYGCDNEVCVTTGWYHFECLCESEKKLLRESMDDDDIQWYCKECFPQYYAEE